MRIAFVAAGAAGMYCGSCLRDNALVWGLKSLGEDATLVPVYTPLRLDEEPQGEGRVFFGALDVYLQQRLPFLRGGGLLARLLASRRLLAWLSRRSFSTDPARLGRLSVSMLRGEEGNQRRSLEELVEWLARDARPDVVHLSNSLLSGLAREVRRATGAPVVVGLQGEDLFLDGLAAPHRSEALGLIRERGADVARYAATSAWAADRMAELAGLERERIDVVLPGIRLDDYVEPPAERPPARPPTIGYLARIAPEKGLHVLAHAFVALCASGQHPGLRLKVAGYLGGARSYRYAGAVRRFLASRGIRREVEILGTVDRAEKLAFLREIDVLAVPAEHPEPKGLFVLEALASGVPVVEPRNGAFPELIEATGGGLLHEPGDPDDLAARLSELLGDEALRRELGRRGREAVFARFTARRMAEETREVYRRAGAGG
ncbi:MAG: glycosyltransferase family 4 protein [Planctomycetes bacterium]|nr:glycosyltransferase family 4 protein [Planctomycetota bacterium]